MRPTLTDAERDTRLEALCRDRRIEDNDPSHVNINSVRGLVDMVRLITQNGTVSLGSVVEVGSNIGVSTEVFLLHADRVVAVDPWFGDVNYGTFMSRVGHYPNLEVVRGESLGVAGQFADETFDMVYLDARHDRASVFADLVAWIGKVKKGGWISGHDHHHDNGPSGGVIEALDEYLPEAEYGRQVFADSSFLIKRP